MVIVHKYGIVRNPDSPRASAIGGSDRGVKAIKDNHRPALAANEMKPVTVGYNHQRPLQPRTIEHRGI